MNGRLCYTFLQFYIPNLELIVFVLLRYESAHSGLPGSAER
jgi:hypothetical protein